MTRIRKATGHFPPIEQLCTQVGTERITFIILPVTISLVVQITAGEEIGCFSTIGLTTYIHTIILAQFTGEDSFVDIPIIFIPDIFQIRIHVRIPIAVMQYVIFIDMSERSDINQITIRIFCSLYLFGQCLRRSIIARLLHIHAVIKKGIIIQGIPGIFQLLVRIGFFRILDSIIRSTPTSAEVNTRFF